MLLVGLAIPQPDKVNVAQGWCSLTLIASQSTCQMFMRDVEQSAILTFHAVAELRLRRLVPTLHATCDHIRAHMPMLGRRMWQAASLRDQNFPCYRHLFAIAHWHRACTLHAVQYGRHMVDETDSATNQFGAPQGAEDPRGTFPLFATGCLPLLNLCSESDYEDH